MAALKYIKQRGGENAWFGITSPMILDSGVAPMVTDPDILESIMKGGYTKMQRGGGGCGMTGGAPKERVTQRGGGGCGMTGGSPKGRVTQRGGGGCGMTGGAPKARVTQRGGSTPMRVTETEDQLIFEKYDCVIVYKTSFWIQWEILVFKCTGGRGGGNGKKLLRESLAWINAYKSRPLRLRLLPVPMAINAELNDEEKLTNYYLQLGFLFDRAPGYMWGLTDVIMDNLNIN
jgi:hypothetical protein